jgi:Right handed beta helix region
MRQIARTFLPFIVGIGYCCIASFASATEIAARSGTAEDIRNAIAVAHPGDTIVIPEGRFEFHGQVFLPDGLSLRGAGRDKTWLIKGDRLGEWKPMLSVDCKTGKPFHFSGITLQGAGRDLQASSVASDHIQDQGIVLRGSCKDFLIFGSRFTKFSRAGIELVGDDGSVHGEPKGVIFDNEFIDNWSSYLGYAVAVNGSVAAWAQPVALGTEQAVFVEDNYFAANRCAIQANDGARYVFRHNDISNNQPDSAPIYAHGKNPYWPRGTRSFEIYNNKVRNPQPRWAGIALGGGSGVIYDNDMDGVSYGIVFMIEGDSKVATHYPYQDQLSDTWVWDNSANGKVIAAPTLRQGGGINIAEFLQQGRDFFLQRKPNFQPFTYPHPARQAVTAEP